MDQLQFYVNGFGDRYLYEVNRSAFNRLGAAAVFRQHFGEKLTAKDTISIVIGTDSGVLVRHVRQIGVPEGSRFLFIELDELLPRVRQELADDELDDNILIIGENALADSLKAVRFSDYAAIGMVTLLESVGAVDAYVGAYRHLAAEIRQQLDSILWVYNSGLSNPSFIRCQLHNLLEEQVPASVLNGTFNGQTAVLLGGGPSLDDILPWVKAHSNDLVIIAVSRISRRLNTAGVTPHIVVSIDPNDLSFDISKEMLLLDRRVLFVHANHVYAQLLAQWPGRSAYLNDRYPWKSKADRDNVSAAGPTVTNTAFSLIAAMGFQRVIFGGIDLCHSAEGFSHAKGSNEYDAGPRLGQADMRVLTNGGRRAETSPDFFNAINAFSGQVQSARQHGVQVINPAPGAAVIEGADYQLLDDISVEPRSSDPFDALHSQLPDDTPQSRRRIIADAQRELARVNGRLRKVIELAEDALECNDGLFGRNGKTADFKYKKRMDKIERQLDTRLKDVSEIVRSFSSRAFLYMPPSDREWTDDEIEAAGKTYYNAYQDNARLLLQLVEQAQTRLTSTLQEELETPDFECLLTQWENDATPGRAIVWQYRHPEVAQGIPAGFAARFDALENAFETAMQERDTTHARKVRDEASITPVRSKLQVLFKERNRDELAATAGQLQKMAGDEARQLETLANGYLAELDRQPDAAFEHYAGLIDLVRDGLGQTDDDASNPRLEDALGRMINLALTAENYDQALLILQTLSGLAPNYLPQYAELLRLTGNTEAAITVYTDYLGLVPGDLTTMLRLGRLYQSIDAKEAAKTAFNYVLQQEPDNKSAQSLLEQIETAA